MAPRFGGDALSVLEGVPYGKIESVWRDIEPLVRSVTDKSLGNYTPEDIYVSLIERDMQLWVSRNDGKIEAICVTRIDVAPNIKTCAIPIIAGSNREHWLDFVDTISAWAKSQGCQALDGFFRDGWKRVLKDQGWSLGWTFARKWI